MWGIATACSTTNEYIVTQGTLKTIHLIGLGVIDVHRVDVGMGNEVRNKEVCHWMIYI